MAIRTAVWKVSSKPEPLLEASLAKEQFLEEMIVAEPKILSDDFMLIGRQEDTGFGGRIDLLALAPDGSLILIELKRSRTPREVVAQALDYAGWVQKLTLEQILEIYGRFAPSRILADDFRQRFGVQLADENLNNSHQIIIVASELDDSSERIVAYLSERDIPINVLCFQVFGLGEQQLLSRAWLLDPIHTQVSAASSPAAAAEPWNGEFYCSFGDSESRSWDDAMEYGFVSAGGGAWYSRTMQLLNPGDLIWVKIPDVGYAGVGRVLGRIEPASSFKVSTSAGEVPALDLLKRANYHREWVDDPQKCEYFVPVRWLETVPVQTAFSEVGLFGNQNTVCKPTTPKWRTTIDRLKIRFPKWNQ
jgi:hypothetical protein